VEEKEAKIKVAFQGEKGAYSEVALYRYFGSEAEALGFPLSEDVFEALHGEAVTHAIVPVENSIAGNVTVNLDLFHHYDFYVYAEVYLPIRHCLLAREGVALSDIQKVYSHPIALAQCRDFLKQHLMEAVPDYDTAGAAKHLSKREKGFQTKGAIASALCAGYYQLQILAENIQTVATNITRFFVFTTRSRVPFSALPPEKTSLAFTTKHYPGALQNCLKTFAYYGLNLTKIESRPVIHNPFEYIFYVDLSGALQDENVKNCLEEMQAHSQGIKILGSYPDGYQRFVTPPPQPPTPLLEKNVYLRRQIDL
jgi:prephenate dehydratase